MRSYLFSTSLFLLTLLSSCVTSMHRLATYDKVVAENRITGKWNYKGTTMTVENFLTSDLVKKYIAKKKNIFEGVGKNDSILLSQSYLLHYEKNGLRYDMTASFIRLNDQLFLDIYPLNVDSISSSLSDLKDFGGAGGNWIASHTFARVNFKNNNSLELEFLGGDFLIEELEKGRMAIRHERDELFDTMVITASSGDLQKFLMKYGNDKRLYDKDNTVILDK